MSISDNSNELSYHMQLTYFTQPGGKRIIAIYESQAGGDCDSSSLLFYSYINGTFIDVTSNVLPILTINNFCPSAPDSPYALFDPIYDLPRFGTTIKVTAQALCEQDYRTRMKSEEYYKYFNKLTCDTLQLVWDNTTGKFSIKK